MKSSRDSLPDSTGPFATSHFVRASHDREGTRFPNGEYLDSRPERRISGSDQCAGIRGAPVGTACLGSTHRGSAETPPPAAPADGTRPDTALARRAHPGE